jgi:hypothetical protein
MLATRCNWMQRDMLDFEKSVIMRAKLLGLHLSGEYPRRQTQLDAINCNVCSDGTAQSWAVRVYR